MYLKMLVSLALGFALVSGELAWADTAAPPSSSDTADSLTEIIVTAEKRAENLQTVPIAITAISGDALQTSGVRTTAELGLVTPGLTVITAAGFVLPHIRGVGTTAYGPGLENSVATYLDGVYFTSGLASLISLNNVSQIEVLKGPQGTLFGRNATGGLIQITTKDPQFTFAGQADIGYGNYQTSVGDLYLTGPVSSTLAADLAVRASTQQQGYGRNIFNGESVYKTDRDIALRSKWKWAPSDSTTAVLSVDYEETAGSSNSTFTAFPGATNLFELLGVVPPLPALGHYDINADFQPYDTFKGGGASVRLLQDVGFAQLQSITAYRHSQYSIGFDADGTSEPIETIPLVHQLDTQYSEELNLSSNAGGRVQWVTGLFYLHAKAQYDPSEVLLGGPLQIPLPGGLPPIDQIDIQGKQTTDAYAAYVQATIGLTSSDHLTLGGRYSQERRGLTGSEPAFLVGGIPIGSLIPQVDASVTSKRPTYRLSLDHQFNDDIMAYASFNTGFKSGGFNVGVPSDPAYKPEVLKAYELGLKTRFLDNRIRFNTAAFYYDYKDIQVGHFVLGQLGYYNGAAAKLYGLDSDIEALVAPGLSLTAGVSLIHDYFSDFPNAVTYTPVPVFGPGGPTLLTSASATDHNLPITPSETFNVGIDYRHQVATGVGNLDVTYAHNGGYAFAPDNILRQSAFNTVNASLAWSTANDGLTISLWGKNLTNNFVANVVLTAAPGSLAAYLPPRTYGILIGTKF